MTKKAVVNAKLAANQKLNAKPTAKPKPYVFIGLASIAVIILCTYIFVGTGKTKNGPTTCDASPLAVIFDKHYQGHPYRDINLKRPKSDFNYKNFQFQIGRKRDYHVEDGVGKGKFAKVYKATHAPTGDVVAIKLFKEGVEHKTLKEIQLLTELKDAPNFLPIRDFLKEQRDDDYSPILALVFDYFKAKHYKELFSELEPHQIKYFMYETLRTLDYIHAKGIVHKDIKPLNVLMDPETMRVKVIDMGHSDHYFPNREKSTRIGSLHYKAPEVLLNYPMFDYSYDIWSAGVMLAEMMFRKVHFFQSAIRYENNSGEKEDTEAKMEQFRGQVAAIAQVLGSLKLRQFVDKNKDWIDHSMMSKVGDYKKQPWTNFINEENKHLYDPLAADLLDQLLTYDHTKRITAKEALKHPYFDEVRTN